MNDTTFFNTILIIIIGNMNSTFIGINIQIFNAKIFNSAKVVPEAILP